MPRMAVIISLFTTESTFIVRELEELAGRGVRLSIYSLRQPSQADREWVRRCLPTATLAAPAYVFSGETLSALVAAAFRRPGRLGATLLRLLGAGLRQPRVLLKTLAVVPKSLAIARQVGRSECLRIHAHWATVAASSAWVASRMTGIPFSFTAHAWDIYTDDALHRLKLEAADAVIVCNEYGRRILLDRNGGDRYAGKVHLVHHGLDLSRFDGRIEGERREARILAVGRLTEQKGFHVLLRACRILRDRGVPFRCDVVGGPGEMAAELVRYVREHGLEDRIRMLGFVPPDRVIEHYRQAALLAAPTVIARGGETDGLPNVILEAMATGLPVIATRVAGIPEAVDHGVSGWLVPPDDPQALAEGLERLLQDATLRDSLGANGRRTIEDRFELRRNVARIHGLLLGAGAATAGRT